MNRSIASMLLATFLLRVSTAITGGMLVFLVDSFTREHGTGPGAISLLTGGFYATELTGAVVFGVLADRYGRKVIMLLGPAFGAVAVFLTGLTTHIHVLFVTRLLEGGSTAASVPSTLGFIAAETSHDERLRGRVVSLFEFVSLGGMLAVGPALAGFLWDAFGRPAFFLNCGLYMVSLGLYAYGVSEVPRERASELERHPEGSERRLTFAGEVRRYLRMATSRMVLRFAPTWLAINAILGLWALQAPLLLKGNLHDPGQFLMKGVSATTIGVGEAVIAVVFGGGLLFWGTVYARFRRSTLLVVGVAGLVVTVLAVEVVNHLGQEHLVLMAAGAVAVAGIFVLSGATPAALGLLADVSEGFEEDRSAIMGLYSVLLGLGQVAGAIVGGAAASWRGIDGLAVATFALLAIGIVALANLRSNERLALAAMAAQPGEGSGAGSLHADASAREERRPASREGTVKENR